MNFCVKCGAARPSPSAKYCSKCGLAITEVSEAGSAAPVAVNATLLASPVLVRNAGSPALRNEIARRTRRGWQIVNESETGVQLRRPKHFSFGWAVLWFVLGIFPMVVYLLWHWAKKDRHAFISVNEN